MVIKFHILIIWYICCHLRGYWGSGALWAVLVLHSLHNWLRRIMWEGQRDWRGVSSASIGFGQYPCHCECWVKAQTICEGIKGALCNSKWKRHRQHWRREGGGGGWGLKWRRFVFENNACSARWTLLSPYCCTWSSLFNKIWTKCPTFQHCQQAVDLEISLLPFQARLNLSFWSYTAPIANQIHRALFRENNCLLRKGSL